MPTPTPNSNPCPPLLQQPSPEALFIHNLRYPYLNEHVLVRKHRKREPCRRHTQLNCKSWFSISQVEVLPPPRREPKLKTKTRQQIQNTRKRSNREREKGGGRGVTQDMDEKNGWSGCLHESQLLGGKWPAASNRLSISLHAFQHRNSAIRG